MTTYRARRIAGDRTAGRLPIVDNTAPWMNPNAPTVPCAENPDWWYADTTTGEGKLLQNAARKACQDCPIRADCLQWALATDEQFGIWGGVDMVERAKEARRAKTAAQKREKRAQNRPRGCGTLAGYSKHRRAKETPCDACRAANAEASRDRRERRQDHEHRTAATLDDWAFLRAQGLTFRQAAEQMGIEPRTLERALHRAKKRGDSRGCLNLDDLNRWQEQHEESA